MLLLVFLSKETKYKEIIPLSLLHPNSNIDIILLEQWKCD